MTDHDLMVGFACANATFAICFHQGRAVAWPPIAGAICRKYGFSQGYLIRHYRRMGCHVKVIWAKDRPPGCG